MRPGSFIGPVIIAIGLVVAALSFAIVGALLETADASAELRLDRSEGEIEDLRQRVGELEEDVRELVDENRRQAEQLAELAGRSFAQAERGSAQQPVGLPDGSEVDHIETEQLDEVLLIRREAFNTGVSQPNNRVMLEILGNPRETYTQDCAPVTNPKLRALLETRQIGPLTVTMIRPALNSLERILARLEPAEPEVYAALGTAGALCARLIRGSRSSISNHSWGTAIDIKIEGRLDGFGDGGTQMGLVLLAELFNEEGWYWGATYGREDSMHFEVGIETLRQWATEGAL